MQSPSNQFAEFLGQLPLGPFVVVCGSALLLMFAIFWIGYLRPKLRQNANTDHGHQNQPESVMPANPEPASVGMMDISLLEDDMNDMDDLPALDDLLDTTGMMDVDAAMHMDEEVPMTEAENELASEEVELPPEPEVPAVMPEPAPAPIPVSTAPSPPAPHADTGERAIELNTGHHIHAEEVVTVYRDTRDGRLVVHLEGVGYRTLLDSPEAKKQFVSVMKELSTVVTEPDENPPTEFASDKVAAEPAPSSAPASPVQEPAAPPPQPVDPPIAASKAPANSNQAPLPGDLPKFDLDESLKPQQGGIFGGRVKYEPQPVPELDIAGSIEAFLQYKLGLTQQYVGREIHVHSAPGGGVRIQVDDTYYEAVSDVTDADVREFLSSTIQEWQDRQ